MEVGLIGFPETSARSYVSASVIILNERRSQVCFYSLVLAAVIIKGCSFSTHHVPPSRPANPSGCGTLEELVMELSVLDYGTCFDATLYRSVSVIEMESAPE